MTVQYVSTEFWDEENGMAGATCMLTSQNRLRGLADDLKFAANLWQMLAATLPEHNYNYA